MTENTRQAKVRQFLKHKAVTARGFSEWTNPTMRGYLMACCDCGLVHEMEFKAFRRTAVYSDGSYEMQALPRSVYGVTMRARRANRHTAQLRRLTKTEEQT